MLRTLGKTLVVTCASLVLGTTLATAAMMTGTVTSVDDKGIATVKREDRQKHKVNDGGDGDGGGDSGRRMEVDQLDAPRLLLAEGDGGGDNGGGGDGGGKKIKDIIFRVQVELKARGFDAGPPDGSIGPKTREALRRFQNAHRLRGAGEIDTATLAALGIR